MEEYTPNSNKFKKEQREASEDRKKVGKVVQGTAKTKKKNEVQKLADVFISEDLVNIKTFIISDVVIPTIKKTVSDTVGGIFDIIRNSVDVALFGESGVRRRNTPGSKVSYNKFYDNRDDRRQANTARTRTRFDYDDIVFETRGDAEAVLDQMEDMIERYGSCSVLELYDMADLTPPPYTSSKYGWANIHGASVIRSRDGYIIKLPRALPFD